MAKRKPSWARGVKCEEDGISFDSRQERGYYRLLKDRKQKGEILDFSRPAPTLMLDIDGYALGSYTPDFIVYERGEARPLLVENKGGRADPAFRLRYLLARVLFAEQYRFEFDGEKEPMLRRVPAKRTRKNFVLPPAA